MRKYFLGITKDLTPTIKYIFEDIFGLESTDNQENAMILHEHYHVNRGIRKININSLLDNQLYNEIYNKDASLEDPHNLRNILGLKHKLDYVLKDIFSTNLNKLWKIYPKTLNLYYTGDNIVAQKIGKIKQMVFIKKDIGSCSRNITFVSTKKLITIIAQHKLNIKNYKPLLDTRSYLIQEYLDIREPPLLIMIPKTKIFKKFHLRIFFQIHTFDKTFFYYPKLWIGLAHYKYDEKKRDNGTCFSSVGFRGTKRVLFDKDHYKYKFNIKIDDNIYTTLIEKIKYILGIIKIISNKYFVGYNSKCYQLFSADFQISKKLNVFLLEINDQSGIPLKDPNWKKLYEDSLKLAYSRYSGKKYNNDFILL